MVHTGCMHFSCGFKWWVLSISEVESYVSIICLLCIFDGSFEFVLQLCKGWSFTSAFSSLSHGSFKHSLLIISLFSFGLPSLMDFRFERLNSVLGFECTSQLFFSWLTWSESLLSYCMGNVVELTCFCEFEVSVRIVWLCRPHIRSMVRWFQ